MRIQLGRGAAAHLVASVLGGLLLLGANAAVAGALQQGSLGYSIRVRPTSGPAGSVIEVRGVGFVGTLCEGISIDFTDANRVDTHLATLYPHEDGRFKAAASIPTGAIVGLGTVSATPFFFIYPRCGAGTPATATFTVTPGSTPTETIYTYCDGALSLEPSSGPSGTAVIVLGAHLCGNPYAPIAVSITFTDASGASTSLGTGEVDFSGHLSAHVTIPDGAAQGAGTIKIRGGWGHVCGHNGQDFCIVIDRAQATFTVT
jgi:hypothetical protein